MKDCIFCKIVKGELPSHKIWEDKNYLAFLGIFPNTEGMSIVIPKKHFSSYAFDLPDNELKDFMVAVKKVARLLDRSFADVGRTALVFEGFGVDHVHAKLFPLHGTKMKSWRPLSSNLNKYFDQYEGFVSSHDADRADDQQLEKLADRISKNNKESM